MISLILSVLIIACSSYIGWGIQSYYKNRIVFYNNVDNFLHYLIGNINFYKDSINKILSNFLSTTNESKYLKNIIVAFMNDKRDFDSIVVKKEERQLLANIFNHLGKSDSENQIDGLKNFSTQVQFLIKKSREDYEKVGKNATKLGFLFGLALAICLL